MNTDNRARFTWIRRRTLAAQFLVRASIVVLAGMFILGLWVTSEIRDGVTRNSASATALYMGSIIAPQLQELTSLDRVTDKTQRALDAILKNTELGRGVVSFKVWKKGGLIAYSSSPSIIGAKFPVTDNLRLAWQGIVTSEYDTLHDIEDALERSRNQPLLEIYVPIRNQITGEIFAVAEFYEIAVALKKDLHYVNLRAWLVVGGVTLMMVAALSGIVIRGSRTIEWQRSQLQGRVEELSLLLSQNEELRTRLQSASNRTAEINERYLRRLGADLHDGPAQSLAFALLRLDALKGLLAGGIGEVEQIREALREAIREIRDICAGLTLGKLEEMSPVDVLRQIVSAHKNRSRTEVQLDIHSIPEVLPLAVKIGMFRFVQEALNNAHRHAGGMNQRVVCRFDSDSRYLEIAVSDGGPGMPSDIDGSDNSGLGLVGLRERIEALGGELKITSMPGEGTKLTMRCRVDV